jgi:sigma-B regulation protein RsbU (phosphoserine phosphatase)
MVIGLFPMARYDEAQIDLRPGDLFVAFTDGVPEAHNAAGEEFGEARLQDVLKTAVGSPADDVAALLQRTMRQWIAGAEQYDDLTVVVVAVNDAAADGPVDQPKSEGT